MRTVYIVLALPFIMVAVMPSAAMVAFALGYRDAAYDLGLAFYYAISFGGVLGGAS